MRIININSKNISQSAAKFASDINSLGYIDSLNSSMIFHANNDVNSVRWSLRKKTKAESYITAFFSEYVNTQYKASGSDTLSLEGRLSLLNGNIRGYLTQSREDATQVEKFHLLSTDLDHDLLRHIPEAEVQEYDSEYAELMGDCYKELSKVYETNGNYANLGDKAGYTINTEGLNMDDPIALEIVRGIRGNLPLSINLQELISAATHEFRHFRNDQQQVVERVLPKSGLLSCYDFVDSVGTVKLNMDNWVFFDSNIIPKGYSYFLAPKKGYKSLRLITAPNVELKYTQARINRVMQAEHNFDESIVAYKPGADHVKYLKNSDLTYDSMLSVDFSNYFSEIRGLKLHTALGEYFFPDNKSLLYKLAAQATEASQNRIVMPINDYNTMIKVLLAEVDAVIYKLSLELAMCKNIGLEPLVLEPCQDIIMQQGDLDVLSSLLRDNRLTLTRSRLRAIFVRSNQEQTFRFLSKLVSILKIQRLVMMKRAWLMLKSALRLAESDPATQNMANSLLNFIFKAVVQHSIYFKINDLHTAAPELRLMGDSSTMRSYMGSFNKRAIFGIIERKFGSAFKSKLVETIRIGRGSFEVLSATQYDTIVKILTCQIPSASGYEKFIKTTQINKPELDEVFGLDTETGTRATIVATAKKFKKCPSYYKTLGLFKNEKGKFNRVFRALPQGGPTSGTVANLLNENILSRLKKELPEIDYKICIYSDNVYVFFNKINIETKDPVTGNKEAPRPVKYIIRDKIEKTCADLNIRLNPNKINMYEDADRKVLGTISDTKGDIRLSRRKMYELNQIIINLNKKSTINYKGKVYTRIDMASYLGKLNWFKRVADGSMYKRKLIKPNW